MIVSGEWSRFVLKMGSTVLLARLLTPDDYGLIGMVTALTGAAFLLQDLGLSQATIQRERVTHGQVNALFWVNVAVGGAIAIGLTLAAPAIAAFYGRQELTGIVVALSITFFILSFSAQHEALLNRQMRFKELTLVEVLAYALSVGSAIVAALLGAGYWSLVVLQLVGAVSRIVLFWTACPWRPTLPRRADGVRDMLTFGGNISLFRVLNYLSRNADNVVIGRFIGAQAVGLYSKAYQLLLMPIQEFNVPLGKVALPTLSSLQDEPLRYRRYYTSIIAVISYVTMPIIAIMAANAYELISILLGSQWTQAAPIFRVLAFAGLAQSVAHANGLLYISTGRTGRQAVWAMISRPIVIVSFFLGLPWGAVGVAVAYTVCQYVLLVPGFALASRGSPVRLGDIADAAWRPLVASVTAYGVSIAAHDLTSGAGAFVTLLVTVAAAAATYSVALAAWPRLRHDLKEIVQFVLSAMRMKTGTSASVSSREEE